VTFLEGPFCWKAVDAILVRDPTFSALLVFVEELIPLTGDVAVIPILFYDTLHSVVTDHCGIHFIL